MRGGMNMMKASPGQSHSPAPTPPSSPSASVSKRHRHHHNHHPGSLRYSGSGAGWLMKQRHQQPTTGMTMTMATAGDESNQGNQDQDRTLADAMDAVKARDILGVQEGATFDQILSAKKKLAKQKGDQEDISEIESAYDSLLMDSLARRQDGRGFVSNDVRYADVPKDRGGVAQLTKWIKTGTGLNVNVGSSSREAKAPSQAQTVTFALIALWIIAQELTSVELTSVDGSVLHQAINVPGTQIAAAIVASLYFNRQEKGLSFGRASAITAIGLCAGTAIGALVEAVLKVDLAPVLGIHSPAMVVGEFGVLGTWFAAAFIL